MIREVYLPSVHDSIESIVNREYSKILHYAKLSGVKNFENWGNEISEHSLNLTKDTPISSSKNLFNFSFLNITPKFIHILKKIYPEKNIIPSGNFYYPPTGFMGWHTNSDTPCDRVYITWASEAGKSFFRYRDPETGHIITDYDDKGITTRRFKVTSEPPHLWHCVGSECDRLSFGLRLYEP